MARRAPATRDGNIPGNAPLFLGTDGASSLFADLAASSAAGGNTIQFVSVSRDYIAGDNVQGDNVHGSKTEGVSNKQDLEKILKAIREAQPSSPISGSDVRTLQTALVEQQEQTRQAVEDTIKKQKQRRHLSHSSGPKFERILSGCHSGARYHYQSRSSTLRRRFVH